MTHESRDTGRTGTSRRRFLKAAAGSGALIATAGAGALGGVNAADHGIPTPQLSVSGNTIVDPSGNTVKLRGVNMADSKRLDVTAPARGMTATQVVEMLTDESRDFYPRVIRIPVQPVDIGEHTPGSIDGAPEPVAFDEEQLRDYIDTHLRPVVDTVAANNVYCILDYHRHWKPLEWAEGQTGPINQDLHEEGLLFWDVVAEEFGDEDHVLFEVYNEPTEPALYGGQPSDTWVCDLWSLFKEQVQPWVDTIREHSGNHVIVGSPGWSQHIQGVLCEEFDGGNLSYTYHIYAGHAVSQNQGWALGEESAKGGGTYGVYEQVPMFVTEFGWQSDLTIQDHGYGAATYLKGTTEEFGKPFMEFLESSPAINWTAWCADPVWLPAMFDLGDWAGDGYVDSVGNPYEDEIPTECEELPCEWDLKPDQADMGQFIMSTLADKRDDMIPSGEIPDTTTTTPGGETPDWPAGATDPDGDGLYEDLSGDGDLNFPDVNHLFQNSDSSAAQANTQFYDFDGDGDLDSQDVLALFELV
ncbi:glycoside hydrolase family 5 protein [Halococcoides cellulosivorans]|nr:cellulase family glycosylhydrolase [Halococcoides cellulosivorans]